MANHREQPIVIICPVCKQSVDIIHGRWNEVAISYHHVEHKIMDGYKPIKVDCPTSGIELQKE